MNKSLFIRERSMKYIVLSVLLMSSFIVYGMESQAKKKPSTGEPTEKGSYKSNHVGVRDNKNFSRSSDLKKVKKNSPLYEKHSLFDGGVFY